MSPNYKKILRQASKYAKSLGYDYDAEDFAQEVAIYAFTKQTEKVYLARRLADYMRTYYGRIGSHKYDAKLFNHTEFDERKGYGSS